MSNASGRQLNLPKQEESAGDREIPRRHWPAAYERRVIKVQASDRDGIQGRRLT